MAYTEVTIIGYNANPPPDDGTEVSLNEIAWAKHIEKIGNPLKTALEAIDDNMKAFSDESPSGQSGTRMLFQQTTAPTGWTKETGATFDDTAMRIVTGTVGSRTDQSAFTTVFGLFATDGRVLTIDHLPAHAHTGVTGGDGGHFHTYNQPIYNNSISGSSGTPFSSASAQAVTNTVSNHTHTIPSQGGDVAHSHNMDIRVNYHDCIVAQKD